MKNEAKFYQSLRASKMFGPSFDQKEFEGVSNILRAAIQAHWPIAYTAYALATAFHETAFTMQPVKERGGYSYYMKLYDISGLNPKRARLYGNTTIGDGAKYCGRGYVQLTWKVNYQKATNRLKVDFVRNPDLAMRPDYAADIMVSGMSAGWFTGKSMSNYLPSVGAATHLQFRQARRIINGQDKAADIADYAVSFQEFLQDGGY